MEDVAHRAVIKNHDFAEVRLDLGQILDVRPIAERAMLTVVPCSKVLALDLQPVDDRIGVLLQGSGEDY